jgi:hypothetical protein
VSAEIEAVPNDFVAGVVDDLLRTIDGSMRKC